MAVTFVAYSVKVFIPTVESRVQSDRIRINSVILAITGNILYN